MSGSSSSSDSGGKNKPPNRKKKKERGNKVDLGSFLKTKEPTEKASKGPTEEAKSEGRGMAAAAPPAAATPAAATPAAAKKTATAVASAVAGTSVATTSAASAVCEPATFVAPMSAAPAANCAAASAATVTAAPAANAPAASAANSETSAAPKLADVVRAASKAAPPPKPVTLRPNLSGSKKGGPTNVPAGAGPSNAGVVAGTSYAQQVSGSSTKGPILDISGSFVTPRPPPPDFGKSRLKSSARLQELFEARWQDDRYGMHIEHIRGSAQSAYLRAIYAVIPSDELFSFGLVGRGMVEVYTTTIEAATKLMLEGIDVGGRHLSPFPVSVKPTRVTFSRVPIRTNQEDLLGFLRRFGKVHGKVRPIPLKIGDEGLGKGVLSTTWEAHITVNQGCVLPPGFNLSAAGSRSYIEVTTEAKCHACRQVGHFIAECPKRTRKAAEGVAKEVPAPTVASIVTLLPDAAPTLEGHSGNKVPENNSQGTQESAETGVTPVREGVTSSDEEFASSNSGKKRRKRKPKRKADQEAMPPPAKKASNKTGVSGEETTPTVPKATSVGSEDLTDVLSDVEAVSAVETAGPTQSGYESCGSTVSIGSRFEVDPDLEEIPREKLRSLLDSLHYKKSADRILTILKQQLGDPARILPQLQLLMREAKKRARYNEVSRFERLFNKVSDILEDRRLEKALLP